MVGYVLALPSRSHPYQNQGPCQRPFHSFELVVQFLRRHVSEASGYGCNADPKGNGTNV